LKLLPGLSLDDENLYVSLSCVKESHVVDNICQYIRGSIAKDDWARLRDRTLAVSKFILTDVKKKTSEKHISPSAYFRLALSQEPAIPFFPHLSDLIIVDADASLAYLELLLAPSLTSLEVSHIPNAKESTLSSFLTTLAQVAPLLQTLSFGPGQFTSKSIQNILQFKNLCQLELKDAVSKMTFAFLESLRSSSPALESLILDARSCEYIPSAAIKEHTHIPHGSFGANLEPIDCKDDEESPQGDTSSSDVGAFSQLMKLHIIGSPSFLRDLILQIASTKLEDVSITISIPREALDIKELEVEKKVERIRWGEKKEMQPVNIAQTSKRMKKRQMQREAEMERERVKEARVLSEMFRFGSLGIHVEEMEIRLAELEGVSEEERRLRAINEQKEVREANDKPFPALLQQLPTCWSTSLKTISVINTFGHSPQQVSIIPPTLLNEVFRLLLFYPTIENITVEGWTPDSVEDSILGLAELAPSNLKSLFLPLDEEKSGISWSTLRHIAITCPKLQSLQCRINPQSLIPKYTVPTTEVLFHGLRTLSVGNSLLDLHSNELRVYHIVRHLDLLFPHLEMITTFEHNAEAEPWIVVNELVKMCQMARRDERYRASAMQQTR
jgi:hypothetical protein